jgi:DNA-binding HxlR family transcriptional regulator
MKKANAKREFDDACGIAHALELVGERWGLLVLRELMLGPRRFSDLKADLPGITPSVLTQRLVEFEDRGLIRKSRLPPPAPVQVYEATEWGLEVEAVLQKFGMWALRSPRHDPTKPVNPVSVILSLKGMFDPAKAGDFRASIGLRLADQTFVVTIADGQLEVKRGGVSGCDATFSGAARDVVAVAYLGAPSDALKIEGDAAIAKRFTQIFSLPSKASPPPE